MAVVSPFACLGWFHLHPGASAGPKGWGGKCPLVLVDQQMLAPSSLARLSQVPFPAFIPFVLFSLVPPMLGRANRHGAQAQQSHQRCARVKRDGETALASKPRQRPPMAVPPVCQGCPPVTAQRGRVLEAGLMDPASFKQTVSPTACRSSMTQDGGKYMV